MGSTSAFVCGKDSTCTAEGLCAHGQVPALSALLHPRAAVGKSTGLVRTERAVARGSLRTRWPTEHTGPLLPGFKDEPPENSSHPPCAPVHVSLLILNSRDFHYWLTVLSPFGDSDFHEGGSHDFLPFVSTIMLMERRPANDC